MGQNGYWWVNQAGIALEIVGAAFIVWTAFSTRAKIKDIPHTFGADLPVVLRDVIAGQAYTERFGFGLLAVGLLLQFFGGFG